MANEKFVPRLTRPEDNNPYYNTKSNGGYSTACKGSPTQSKWNVCSNCVGYVFGRFNEIAQNTKMSYLRPVNAELFMQYKGSLETGMIPRVGACMVWQKGATLSGSDGAGHVAIVEKVISDTEVVTSESGWKAKNPFWTQTRKKGKDGNWGQASSYKFLGFIYNPAPCCQNSNISINSSNTSTSTSINSTVNQNKTVQSAKLKDTKLSGTYTVIADDGLNLRLGAGIDFESILLMPKGTKISNYGFYNAVGSVKWLYVQCVINGKKYLGYCSINYLKKQ